MNGEEKVIQFSLLTLERVKWLIVIYSVYSVAFCAAFILFNFFLKFLGCCIRKKCRLMKQTNLNVGLYTVYRSNQQSLVRISVFYTIFILHNFFYQEKICIVNVKVYNLWCGYTGYRNIVFLFLLVNFKTLSSFHELLLSFQWDVG